MRDRLQNAFVLFFQFSGALTTCNSGNAWKQYRHNCMETIERGGEGACGADLAARAKKRGKRKGKRTLSSEDGREPNFQGCALKNQVNLQLIYATHYSPFLVSLSNSTMRLGCLHIDARVDVHVVSAAAHTFDPFGNCSKKKGMVKKQASS